MRTDDNPRAQLYEAMTATVFVASPYRRPIVGWMSDLDAMTPADARAFFRRWYTPRNAALVVAGDVDPQQVRLLAEKYYGPIASGELAPRKPREEPPQLGLRRLDVKVVADQAYVALSFKVPSLSATGLDANTATAADNDALALTVLAAVLDGYSGARLDRALTQGDAPIANSAGAYNGLWGRGPQLFTLDGVPVKGKSAQQIETALREQVARVAREGVSEAELQRVKTQWVAGEIYKLDSVFNQARSIGVYWTQGLPPDAGSRLLARLRGVSAQRVQDVAARYFGDDQLTVATLVPQPPDPSRKPRIAPLGARH